MSVTGFNTTMGVQKYDYNSLDNIPSSASALYIGKYKKEPVDADWTSGGINNITGAKVTDNTRIRTGVRELRLKTDALLITAPSDYLIAVYAYSTLASANDLTNSYYEGLVLDFTSPDSDGKILVNISDGLSFIVSVKKSSGETIGPEIGVNVHITRCFLPNKFIDEAVLNMTLSDEAEWSGNAFYWSGGTLNLNSGAENNSIYVMRTNFLPIQPKMMLRFNGISSETISEETVGRISFAYFYDSTQTYIKRISLTDNTIVDVPIDARYVRFTYGYESTSGQTILQKTTELINDFAVVISDDRYKLLVDALGLIEFTVKKGSYLTNGSFSSNTVGICISEPIHLPVGSRIKVKIWGNWVYSVLQGDGPTTSRVRTHRLVNYSEIEVQREYVFFIFYKRDDNGNEIDVTVDDFDNNIMLFRTDEASNNGTLMHDIPENIGVLNVVNRAYQMAKISYTTVANLPTQVNTDAYPGYFPTGTELTGVIYSSVRGEGLYVPQCVSFQTYMTAIKNPNSYIYTKTETETWDHKNAKTYYGAVCSSLAGYCYGIDDVIPTTISLATYPGMEVIEDQSPYGLKIGDLLLKSDGHAAIVTDIIRDSRGVIVKMEITDQVAPTARSRYIDPENIISYYFHGDYVGYHYHYIYKVPYTASPWVNLDYEMGQPTYSTYLSPRRGEDSNWRYGEDVVVDILDDGGYSYIKLFYAAPGLIPTEVDSKPTGKVHGSVTYTNLDAGAYTVRLTNGTSEDTDPVVNFDVVQVNVGTPTVSGRDITVPFTSGVRANPCSISLCYPPTADAHDRYGVRAFHILTNEDLQAQHGTVTAPEAGDWLVKVMFKTRFGLYSSDFVSVTVS